MLEGVNKASLTAVPFFIMAGNLMNATGVTERIFAFANALVGHMKAVCVDELIEDVTFGMMIGGELTTETEDIVESLG